MMYREQALPWWGGILDLRELSEEWWRYSTARSLSRCAQASTTRTGMLTSLFPSWETGVSPWLQWVVPDLIMLISWSVASYGCIYKVHGRSREQRYTKVADWEYIKTCAAAAHPVPLFGNGDMLSFEDYNHQLSTSGVDGIMIARYIFIILHALLLVQWMFWW